MAKRQDPREEAEKAKKKPGGQQHQNPPSKTSTDNPERNPRDQKGPWRQQVADGGAVMEGLERAAEDEPAEGPTTLDPAGPRSSDRRSPYRSPFAIPTRRVPVKSPPGGAAA